MRQHLSCGRSYLEIGDLARLRLHEVILPAGLLVRAIQLAADVVKLCKELLDAAVLLCKLVPEDRGIVVEYHVAQLQPPRTLVLDQEVALMDGVSVLHVEGVQGIGSLPSIEVRSGPGSSGDGCAPVQSPCLRMATRFSTA